MIKFNDNNIYVGHIKELLHSFNLPTCKVKKDDSKFYVGEYYIDRDFEEIRIATSVDGTNKVTGYKKVCDYKYDDEVLNLTKHLEIRNNYYDSYTHEYLGKYLRFIKDYLGLNLMPMYNCFSNQSASNIDIEIYADATSNYVVTTNADYHIFMIPVRANTDYTLSLEYQNSISMFYGFYSHNKYIQMTDKPSTSSDSIEAKTFVTYDAGLTFSKPVLLHSPELTEEEQIKQEDNLKLFIILPTSYTDNIVLLEGDYRKNSDVIVTEDGEYLGNAFFEHIPGGVYVNGDTHTWFFNDIDTEKADSVLVDSCDYSEVNHQFTVLFSDGDNWVSPVVNAVGNYDYLTRLKLLAYQTHEKYLLSDRLREYLSDNVITHIDEIISNIKRVQILIAGYDKDFTFDIYGKWSEDINKWIYKYISTHGHDGDFMYRDIYKDLLCYVDKDVESILQSLKNELDNKVDKSSREVKALRVLDALGGIYA